MTFGSRLATKASTIQVGKVVSAIMSFELSLAVVLAIMIAFNRLQLLQKSPRVGICLHFLVSFTIHLFLSQRLSLESPSTAATTITVILMHFPSSDGSLCKPHTTVHLRPNES